MTSALIKPHRPGPSGAFIAVSRVTYRMTDQMGVVYYGNYLELFEIGRNEMFRSHGIDYREMEREGYMLPCTHSSCDYIRPARFDDALDIHTRVSAGTRAKIHFAYEVRRQADDVTLARGVTHHVFLSPEGRLRRLPPHWWSRLEPIFRGNGSEEAT